MVTSVNFSDIKKKNCSHVVWHSCLCCLRSALPETFVGPKTISGPESFVTEVAGDDDSFEVVCFNVIFYVLP